MHRNTTALVALALGFALAACTGLTDEQQLTCTDLETKEVVLQKQSAGVVVDGLEVRALKHDGSWDTYLLPANRLLECKVVRVPPG